jgi:arylsulfatase A-like enzyme
MARRSFRSVSLVASLVALLLLAVASRRTTVAAAQQPSRPNVVVILVDDMGWSDIEPFGSEIATPNLEALASTGIRFTQFYSTPRCSPSRASLLTGLYPHQAGMGHLDTMTRPGSLGITGRLNDRSVTIPEVLREAGYFTIMSGKWHLGQNNGTPPWVRGFDRSLSLNAGGMYFPNQNYQGQDAALTERARESLYLNGVATPRDASVFGKDWYSPYLWTSFALKFIDDARQAGRPFFLYLPHNAPHFPLMAPAELIAKYRGRYKAGWDRLRQARYERQIQKGLIDRKWPLSPREPDIAAWDSLSDQQKDRFDQLMAVYAAMIEAIDTSIGTLVRGLESRGLRDNTVIFFMSDNGANAESGPNGRMDGEGPGGPNSNLYLGMSWASLGSTPFRRYKHFTLEGGISSPLIVSWPGGIAANRRNTLERQPAHLIDLMPTIVDLTRARYPTEFKGSAIQPMEGVSLRPVFAGQTITRTQPIFWEHEGNRAVRSANWKIVSTYPGEWELYDMTADRVERNNVAAQHPDIVARLGAAWDAWAKRANVDPWPGPELTPWGDNLPRGGRAAGARLETGRGARQP